MKPGIKQISVIILSTMICACARISPSDINQTKLCPGYPQNFSQDDLIGTWVTSYSLNDTDTIIINADGTFKQVYDDPDASQRYESDWAEWTIEYRDNNLARLHLKGMRLAGVSESVFNRVGGGVDPEFFTAIDYCENEVLEMPNEVVLIVTGTTSDAPRGIILRQTRLAGSEWTWSFELLEE